jgi:hypothetical protein
MRASRSGVFHIRISNRRRISNSLAIVALYLAFKTARGQKQTRMDKVHFEDCPARAWALLYAAGQMHA